MSEKEGTEGTEEPGNQPGSSLHKQSRKRRHRKDTSAWKVGPLRIERTIDITALTALILSLVGLGSQVSAYLRGPDVILFPTDAVDFANTPAWNETFNNGANYVLLGVEMNYINKSGEGYDAAIRHEILHFVVNGKTYQYSAFNDVNTYVEKNVFVSNKISDASTFSLPAGQTIYHEVLFMPRRLHCLKGQNACLQTNTSLDWNEFLSGIKTNPTVEITTTANIFGKPDVSATCSLTFNQADIQSLINHGWSSPDCYETSQGSLWDNLF